MARAAIARRFPTRWLVIALVAIAVGLPVAVQALTRPAWQARILVPSDTEIDFTDVQFTPVVTISGDAHLNVTGSWVGSAPTWQTWATSQATSVPVCFPRCGNASMNGTVSISSDLCTTWPDGGSSYPEGRNLTLAIGFATLPGSSDVVRLHLEILVSHTSACAG